MSWSFNPSLPTTRDRVRSLVGDTVSTDQQLQNETIDALLVDTGDNAAAAAIQAAKLIAASYARKADKWVGDLKILASQKSRAYHELAKELGEVTSAQYRGIPTAGGISVAKKEMAEEDTDRTEPFFRRGMMDNEISE